MVVGWPYAEYTAYKADVEGNFLKTLELSPAFAERVRSATRVDRFHGSPVPNFFRKPYGPGWALVGDAGYTKDPITAQGISDAFRDAELCAEALDARSPADSRSTTPWPSYQTDTRRRSRCRCTSSPPNSPPSSRRRPSCNSSSAGIHGNQTRWTPSSASPPAPSPPPTFFDPANIGRIMAARAA